MVVSLPSSLTGVVRRKEVSDYFHAKALASGSKKQQHRQQRYYDGDASRDAPLTDLFRQGQARQHVTPSFSRQYVAIFFTFRARTLATFACFPKPRLAFLLTERRGGDDVTADIAVHFRALGLRLKDVTSSYVG